MTDHGTTLVLFHGASRLSRPNLEDKWLPALRQVLGEDWQIELPELPSPEAPDADAWMRTVLEAIGSIEGRVRLVGHSLGGSVLLQCVARELPIREPVFVVAAPFWCGRDSDWQHEPFKLTDRDIETLQTCSMRFYHGTTDDIVPFSHMSEYKDAFPQAAVRSYVGMNHIDPTDTFLRDLATDILASTD